MKTLPILTKKEFAAVLKKRKLEDLDLIKLIESWLKKKRGYIFKMPKKGSDVVLMASGGLDSMTCWGLLMKEYDLNVYPITFDRGEKRRSREEAAFDFFDDFYKKRFPKNYRAPLKLKTGLGKVTLPIETAPNLVDSRRLLEYISNQVGILDLNASLGSFVVLPFYAKCYAEKLNLVNNLKIDTIFNSITANDGEHVPTQTLTSLRSIMLALCASNGEYKWQFSSVAMEKETGVFMRKSALVKYADKNDIPLEKTWSCYHAKKYQCGVDCITCEARIHSFKEAGIKDKTIYKSLQEQNLIFRLKQQVKKIVFYFVKPNN